MRNMEEREAAIKRETDELKALLVANTDLTRQDKDLTQRIETLTREIHERLSR
jgi:flagellar motor switch protein FliM